MDETSVMLVQSIKVQIRLNKPSSPPPPSLFMKSSETASKLYDILHKECVRKIQRWAGRDISFRGNKEEEVGYV